MYAYAIESVHLRKPAAEMTAVFARRSHDPHRRSGTDSAGSEFGGRHASDESGDSEALDEARCNQYDRSSTAHRGATAGGGTIRPRVVVLVGLPGSGNQRGPDVKVSRFFRAMNFGSHSRTTKRTRLSTRKSLQRIRYLLRRRLDLQRPLTFIDATNITRRERRPYIQMASALRLRCGGGLLRCPACDVQES